MAKKRWTKTTFPGVRFREHPTRKNGVRFDQYFTIRYKKAGRDHEEGLGWASEDWTAAKAYDHLKGIKENIKTGEGVQSLAEKRKAESERRRAEGAALELQKKEAITVKDFFESSYLPQARADKKLKSVAREESLFRLWIAPVIGKMPMKDVAPFHVEKIKRNMAAADLSPRSIEYCLSVVRQIFNTARRFDAFTGENPTAKVKFPKPDNARMRFLTHAEADLLLRALKEKSQKAHDEALLSLHCGLRFGEIAALTGQDVDLEQGILTIRDAKAGSRYSFLTDQARDMLRGRKPGNPQDLVFPGRLGKKQTMPSLSFRRVIDELGFNAGIDDPRLRVSFHSCRHTYASWMIEAGTDLYTLQRLLGHKTSVMTQRYAHLSANRLKDAAKALSRAVEQKNHTTDQGVKGGGYVEAIS